jgi:hypothetical protein
VLLLRGNAAASGQITQDLLPIVHRIGDAQLLAPALITAALWELAAKNTSRAVQFAKEFVEISGDVPVYVCWQLTDAARIFVAGGESETLAAIIDRVEPGLTRDRLAVAAARALLIEATEDLSQAEQLHLEAAKSWDAFSMPFEQAHSLFGAGRCLIGLGRASEAREHLEKARALFGSLGALPLVAEVDAVGP